MNKQNKWSLPILAASLALCLSPLALAQEAGGAMAKDMSEMKLGPIPGLPTCASGVAESGDPSKGAAFILAKLTSGCTIPWHWHTAGENLMFVSGAAKLDIKDGKTATLKPASFVLLPSRHVHQFRCTRACTFFIYTDGAFDIHYVDAQGKELSPDDALKAVKEMPAKAM